MEEIMPFLEEYHLEEFAGIFRENEFDCLSAVLDIVDDDLREMGIQAIGKRRKISAAIKLEKEKGNSRQGKREIGKRGREKGERG